MNVSSDEKIIADMQHWLVQAVIGLNLCPFAKAVHVKAQIRYVVSHVTHPDDLLQELESELTLLANTPASAIDTTLLMHPAVLNDFIDFHFFQQEAEALLKRMDLQGVIQVASFHPQFEFAGAASDDVANYTNRAPYPTLHLLRETSIDRAVAAFPDAADIYERNIQTLQTLGHEGWQALLKKDDYE